MKQVIGFLLILGALWGAKNLFDYWEQVKRQQAGAPELASPIEADPAETVPVALPGLPAHLESSLAEAKSNGAASLKIWLNRNRSEVRDPRLAEIELDYLVLAGARDYAENKAIFQDIKQRIPSDSPLTPRIQRMASNYE